VVVGYQVNFIVSHKLVEEPESAFLFSLIAPKEQGERWQEAKVLLRHGSIFKKSHVFDIAQLDSLQLWSRLIPQKVEFVYDYVSLRLFQHNVLSRLVHDLDGSCE
jgi:hypothetical protein